MDSNQTIQLKPIYPHSHISLYGSPVISATMPSLSIASGFNIVSTATTNGNSDINNLNALATLQASAVSSNNNSAQLVPVTSTATTTIPPTNNVCLNNIQIQQMSTQSFPHNHLQAQSARNTNGQQAQPGSNQLLQIQITGPSLLSGVSTRASEISTTINIQDAIPMVERAANDSSSLSNESSTSTLSEPSSKGMNATDLKESRNNKEVDVAVTNYVNLARASCSSSGSAISIKLSSSDSSYVKASNGKGFKCQICNRDFTQKGNLKTHMMTHSGERPYECQTCGKNFTQKGNLDTHVKIHTETKDHKCQYCDRGFTQRGNLKTHIRSIHTKEKPYACGHCGKAFSQKGNMLTHYRTHDKEARFPCNVCGKTFSQKGNLKTHQQRHGCNSGR